MSISADGTRSRRRIATAQRMLDVCRALGLPALTKQIEGFTYSVKNISPELDVGHISAPMGAAVACSQPDGVGLFVSEYYLSAILGRQAVSEFPTEDSAAVESYVPAPHSAHGEQALPPQPCLTRLGGETITLALPGPAVGAEYECAVRVRPYIPAKDVVAGVGFYTEAPARRSLQALMASAGSLHLMAYTGPYTNSGAPSQTMYATQGAYINPTMGVFIPSVPLVYQFNGVPSGLRTEMTTAASSKVKSLGVYSFNLAEDAEPVVLTLVDARDQDSVVTPPSGHGDYADWFAFASRYDVAGGTVTTFGKAQVLSALTAIFGAFTTTDQAAVVARLTQLSGWPNTHDDVPPDNAMFHDDVGNIYTWTRAYGAVRFSSSAITHLVPPTYAPLVMPAAVTGTVGVRPEIYRLGGGQYLCIAFKPGKVRVYGDTDPEKIAKLADWVGVRGVYLGSPFGTWEEIPPPDAETYRLLSVRAVDIPGGVETAVLSAVVSDIPDPDDPEPPPPVFWFAMRLAGAWRILSRIPAEVADRDNVFWATGLYGDDPQVEALGTTLAQPHAVPQAVVLPYSAYAAIIP